MNTRVAVHDFVSVKAPVFVNLPVFVNADEPENRTDIVIGLDAVIIDSVNAPVSEKCSVLVNVFVPVNEELALKCADPVNSAVNASTEETEREALSVNWSVNENAPVHVNDSE